MHGINLSGNESSHLCLDGFGLNDIDKMLFSEMFTAVHQNKGWKSLSIYNIGFMVLVILVITV